MSLPACDLPGDPLLPRLPVLHVLLGGLTSPGLQKAGQGRGEAWSCVGGGLQARGFLEPVGFRGACGAMGPFTLQLPSVTAGTGVSPLVPTYSCPQCAHRRCLCWRQAALVAREVSSGVMCVFVSGSSAISTGPHGDSAKISSLYCLKLNPDFFLKKLVLVVLGLRCGLQGLSLAAEHGL